MSRYAPLSEHLAGHPADEWRPSFSELEAVLGFSLPRAARRGRTWWVNDPDKTHCRAWTVHGWVVGDVDQSTGRVLFRRGAQLGPDVIQPSAMYEAAEAASAKMHTERKVTAAAMAAASVAVVAGLGAMILRTMPRRR